MRSHCYHFGSRRARQQRSPQRTHHRQICTGQPAITDPQLVLVNDRVGRPNGSGVPVFTLGTPGQRYSSVSVRGRLASDKQILVIIILILHSLYVDNQNW